MCTKCSDTLHKQTILMVNSCAQMQALFGCRCVFPKNSSYGEYTCMHEIMTIASNIQKLHINRDNDCMHNHDEILNLMHASHLKTTAYNLHLLSYIPDPEFGNCCHWNDVHKLNNNTGFVLSMNNHTTALYKRDDCFYLFDPLPASVEVISDDIYSFLQKKLGNFTYTDATLFELRQ